MKRMKECVREDNSRRIWLGLCGKEDFSDEITFRMRLEG